MNKEGKSSPTGNIESESTSGRAEPQPDSALQIAQAITAPVNPEAPLSENVTDNATSEYDSQARSDLILQPDRATSDAKAYSDSSMSSERASTGRLDPESGQTGNIEDISTSASVTGAPSDLALTTEQSSTIALAQRSPEAGDEENKSTAESPPETHTGRLLSKQQTTATPVDQEPPFPSSQAIDKHLRLEKRVSLISVIVAVLSFLAIAVQAWISNQQRTIMSTQVDNTQKNLQLTERAYIGVASLNVDLAQGEIVVMLENLGRKPAKGITMVANAFRVSAIEYKKGEKINFKAGDVRLFPGNFKMRVVVRTPKCDPQEIKAINQNRQFLYVNGTIYYDDGFGFTDSTSFAFKYVPPPKEGWEAVGIPVSEFEEGLISEVFKLSINNRITIDPPSFEPSRKLSSPTYNPSPSHNSPSPPDNTSSSLVNSPSPLVNAPSPLLNSSSPSASAINTNTPLLIRQLDLTSKCACSCRMTCENRCEYECSGCSLIEGVTVASACCKQAENSIGEMPRCPGNN